MRRIVWALTSVTVWAVLAAVAGASVGYEQGYRHGVRDIGRLVIEWRNSPESPERFSKGEI